MSIYNKPSFELKERKENDSFEKKKELFEKYFPEGKIQKISLQDVPDKVLKEFEKRSSQFIPSKFYRPKDFDHVYLIKFSDGTNAYLVDKINEYLKAHLKERSHYIVDIDQKGELIGIGEIRSLISNEKSFFQDKPFMGWTYTAQPYRRLGYGLRRLVVSNAISQMDYKFPLNSDFSLTKEAKSLWKQLVEQGKARVYEEVEGKERYAFLPE